VIEQFVELDTISADERNSLRATVENDRWSGGFNLQEIQTYLEA